MCDHDNKPDLKYHAAPPPGRINDVRRAELVATCLNYLHDMPTPVIAATVKFLRNNRAWMYPDREEFGRRLEEEIREALHNDTPPPSA